MLSAKSKALAREKFLYEEILDILSKDLTNLIASAEAVAELDVLNSFADRAVNLNYTLPKLSSEPELIIENGRHPVVETVLREDFVANDLCLNNQQKMMTLLKHVHLTGGDPILFGNLS